MARQEINAVSVFACREIMVSRDALLHIQTGIFLQTKAGADNLHISRILLQEVIRQVCLSCLADLFLCQIHRLHQIPVLNSGQDYFGINDLLVVLSANPESLLHEIPW